MRRFGLLTASMLFTALPVRGENDAQIEPPLKDADRRYWAFQPLTQPKVPKVKNSLNLSNAIDSFIRSKLEERGLSDTKQADRLALLRRVSFDLTGLPPSPAEIDSFIKDERPDAYERVVDRLLASPHYGERWAQHWLDVVRYAESNGYEGDSERPSRLAIS